jgi:hypothetical protein
MIKGFSSNNPIQNENEIKKSIKNPSEKQVDGITKDILIADIKMKIRKLICNYNINIEKEKLIGQKIDDLYDEILYLIDQLKKDGQKYEEFENLIKKRNDKPERKWIEEDLLDFN